MYFSYASYTPAVDSIGKRYRYFYSFLQSSIVPCRSIIEYIAHIVRDAWCSSVDACLLREEFNTHLGKLRYCSNEMLECFRSL